MRAKARVKKTRENLRENPEEPKVPEVRTRAKYRKLVSKALKTRNRRQAQTLRNRHRHVPLTLPGTMVGMVTNGTMAGVLMNGMMTGVLLDGTKVGNKRMTSQALFHLEVWMSVPPVVRSGLNGSNEPGHRSCSEHIPSELWSRRSRRWKILYRTASCKWIPDGGAQNRRNQFLRIPPGSRAELSP